MPALGADMTSGTLMEWRVKPGDAVKRGDIVAVIDTSKAEIEVEIFEDGVIEELLVAEGTRVPVGTALARLRSPTTAAPSAPPAAAPQQAPAHRPHVSPVARRMAEQLHVDLGALTGSEPDGAITKADVELAAGATAPVDADGLPPAAASAPIREAAVPATMPAERASRQAAMRQAIGALMARSKQEIPHYYLQTQIDMSRALGWLEEQNLHRPPPERLLPAALLLSAVASAAAATPALNGFWIEGAFHPADRVHLGVAISLRGGGLVAPALHDADHKTLDELMAALRDLVTRARTGRLRASEMSDPSITVTNLGEQGVEVVHGVIYPPQVALVGFGGIHERPWATEGMLGARPLVTATLAADHRASDGHTGSRFLTLIDRRLQKPEEL
jgi:pyruvate dehydrogenase E2 component (dihydrolipoamide acetyltransferase)